MKKIINYTAVTISFLMVCCGLFIDLVSDVNMNGKAKIIIYVTPMALLFANMLAGIKLTRDAGEKEKIKKRILWSIFGIYILSLSTLLFLCSTYRSACRHGLSFSRVNLIPFTGMAECLIHGSINSILINIGGNLLAFAPMGFFFPLLFGGRIKTLKGFILLMTITVSAVELTQFLTGTGVADIDDVILNVLGAVIIYGITRAVITKRMLKKS